jgi:SAM-dependent methyltransferase
MDVANPRTAVLVASKLSLEMVSQERVWSERYSSIGDEYLFGKDPNRYLVSQIERIKKSGKNVLLVADGEGRNASYLASHGLDVVAFDISPVAIEKAKALATINGVKADFMCADMFCDDFLSLLPKQHFDWVIGIFIQFTDSKNRLKQLELMKALTKPGGCILLQGYTPKQLEYKTGGPPDIDHLYTTQILQSAFKDWVIEELIEYEEIIHEGPAHDGLSALIGMIAKKEKID